MRPRPLRVLTRDVDGEGVCGGAEAQHVADHGAVHDVEIVVAHGAPDVLVPHLHPPAGYPRNQTHMDCGDVKRQLVKVLTS